ncbi:MAG TPA: serine/threonine-protein phosphatase [Planctomycetaceae bacterium]|nr:serine/threonine-protein phosphatase [Planctomycetaceae bacterium]
MVQFKWGAVSITGSYRENNEDAYCVHPEGYYFLVADGMGGQSAGERASELAIELIPKRLESSLDFAGGSTTDPVRIIDEAVAYANSEIMALSQLDPDCHNMGTTIAFVVRCGEKWYAGGVGDSRVYWLRGEKLEQLTTDHSLTQALVDAKTITVEEAANHRYRNVLYRYLGTKEGGKGTEAKELQPQPGDRLLICSDGVTDGLSDEELLSLLRSHDDPQVAAEAIVQAAESGGSRDNITCIVIFVE